MKFRLVALVLATLLGLHAGENLAPGVLYPQTQGEWTQFTGSAAEKAETVEISPGHFYLLHPTPKKHETGLYHTTKPADFNLANTKINVKAMHLVVEFPVTEARLLQKNGQWLLVGKRKGAENLAVIPLIWSELAPIPTRKIGDIIRVALFDDYGSFGKGVPRCAELLSKEKNVKVMRVKPSFIRGGGLNDFDVVVFTGGSGGKQAGALGLLGREQVRRFIEAGGGYVGICAGNYLACDGFSWSVHVLNAKTKSTKWARGQGDLQIEFTPKGQKILGMPAGLQNIRYANGPIFNPADNGSIGAFETLAYFRTELAQNGSPVGAQINSPAIVIGTYGQGRVLCSSPHPEQQSGMEHFMIKAVQWAAGKK